MGSYTRAWKVYGQFDGARWHRQRESFNKSVRYDFSDAEDGIRIIELINADKTGTHEYSIIRITRSTFWECEMELDGQLTDGAFENSMYGDVVEIMEERATTGYWTADRGTGTLIDCFDTIEEATQAIKKYEDTDREDDSYEPDFYDVVDGNHNSFLQ